MPKFNNKFHLLTVLPLAIVIANLLNISFIVTRQVGAVSLANWDAGLIMDDVVMSKKDTMTVSQIQSFIESKVPVCDTAGQQISEYGGPDLNNDGKVQRWEWGKYYHKQTVFICLKNYKENNISAAQIIYNASQSYSINPQVLLVLLQKEQALITDTWPLNNQYRIATGYGCPDNADCDEQYYGFTNQVYNAARHFNGFIRGEYTSQYSPGSRYILYNPSASCGGSYVNIKNRATQALYTYTPYQPNRATLNALWGTASCGAYGNRNFFLYFNSWFGSTRAYVSLTTPRWMEFTEDTYKMNPATGETIKNYLVPAGTRSWFNEKVLVNGVWYLRTRHDTDIEAVTGIPLSNLSEITPNFETMLTPRWMELKYDTTKIDPITERPASGVIKAGTKIYFPEKFIIGENTYLRTQHDTDAGINYGIKWSDVKDTEVVFEDAQSPRWMRMKEDTGKYDIRKSSIISPLNIGDEIFIDRRVDVNGVVFVNNFSSMVEGEYVGVKYSDLEEIPPVYNSLLNSRYMKVNNNTVKVNPITATLDNYLLSQNMITYFSSYISVGGQMYYRTRYDTNLNINLGIPLSNLSEITPNFETMLTPRWMELKYDTTKIDPITERPASGVIKAGTKIYFPEKFIIGENTYLRTQHDTDTNLNYGIKWEDLREIILTYVKMIKPRKMKTTSNVYKINPRTMQSVDSEILLGQELNFDTKIYIGSKWYLRTQSDTLNRLDKVIDINYLSEAN